MIPYFVYLLYVGAVIGFCILVLRREAGRKGLDGFRPDAEAVALLRGGLGAVLETVIFRLYVQKKIDLTTNGPQKKLQVAISRETTAGLSALERATVATFAALQGKHAELLEARRDLLATLQETQYSMQKAGWWKTPARWRWLITLLAPCLIAIGSLQFLGYYEGLEKWILAMTVPFLAVIGRRIVAGELEGPTRTGKKILGELQRQCDSETDIVRRVALNGAKMLENHKEYHAFYFMTHSLPYANL